MKFENNFMSCPFTCPKMLCAGPNILSQPKNLTALMPCPFTGPKMFCAGPNILSQPKNLTAHLVPLQKLLCWHKNQVYWMQITFLSRTKCLWLPQYVNKCLVWHKKFGPAQNILGPVKGQGIRGQLATTLKTNISGNFF